LLAPSLTTASSPFSSSLLPAFTIPFPSSIESPVDTSVAFT